MTLRIEPRMFVPRWLSPATRARSVSIGSFKMLPSIGLSRVRPLNV